MATSGVTFREPTARSRPPARPEPAGTERARTAPGSRPGPSRRQERARTRATAAAEALPQPAAPRSPFRERYGVPYDTQGPRVRLGVAWALVVVASLAPHPLRPYGLAIVYATVAGFAAAQIVDAFRQDGGANDRIVAALGASALPVLATLGARALGVGLLLVVGAAIVVATTAPDGDRPVLGRAGTTAGGAAICGCAAASLVLLADYEIGAVIILLIFVMVYDASDFVVGSGATNGIEGPLAGALMIGAVTVICALLNVPPFRGVDVWSFSALAMVTCPMGQLLASALLPSARTHAPALRRLDSLLVVAPAWAGLVGLYLQHAAA